MNHEWTITVPRPARHGLAWAIPTRPRQGRAPVLRSAISLLETTIAVGILGVGLIMVAAIFPVALSQHRDTTDQARATALLTKAQSMLQSRLRHDLLWMPSDLPAGQDSPWYPLPSTNLYYQADAWDWMAALVPPSYTQQTSYANVISGVTDADYSLRNGTRLTGLDTLSDRLAPFTAASQSPPSPFTDGQFVDVPSRLAWYGFYRRIAGKFAFSVAICRQQRNQLFVQQDLSAAAVDPSLATQAQNPYSTPLAAYSSVMDGRRLPVPWRVSVGRAAPNILFNTPTTPMLGGGIPLGRLAPPGSKIMVQGAVHEEPPTAVSAPFVVPGGRVLTVAGILYDAGGMPSAVEIVEDISELPWYFEADGKVVTFDIWLFPPAVTAGKFDRSSPLIEWKSML